MKTVMTTLAVILGLLFLATSITMIVKSIQFDQQCGGYLKRAADANTVEMAKDQLKISIDYIEINNLTNGYTSVLYNTPDEDLGFWYKNITNSYKELVNIPDSASALLKSNMLMKLRETLLDKGKKGDDINLPNGISRYPHNLLFGIMFWFSILLCLLCATISAVMYD